MPIVPVIKKGKVEAVRICRDFKVSINPVLRAVHYPLPRIEDIFAALAGGEKFLKDRLSPGLPTNGDRGVKQEVHHNQHSQRTVPAQQACLGCCVSSSNVVKSSGPGPSRYPRHQMLAQ